MAPKPKPIADRLRQRTRVTADGCWEYDCKASSAFGHKVIRVGTRAAGDVRNEFAHRVSWVERYGPIPDGLCVLHRCDNPACINPDHLFLGTRADNTNDMLAKKREAFGDRLPQTKLSPADVIAIRSSPLSNREIARQYGMNDSTICVLRQGKIHKHVG